MSSARHYSSQSHYEISEPLMRLVLEVKEARATPVPLLINFLRHWFSSTDPNQFAEHGQCTIFGKPWLGKEFVYQAIEQNSFVVRFVKLITFRRGYQSLQIIKETGFIVRDMNVITTTV